MSTQLLQCPIEPTVNNGQLINLTNTAQTVTATYQCLSGFQMSGMPRIVCNHSYAYWPRPPTCSVIRKSTEHNIYNYIDAPGESWLWRYALLGVLGLIALLLLLMCCWRCCCMSNRTDISPEESQTRRTKRRRCCCCHKKTRQPKNQTPRTQNDVTSVRSLPRDPNRPTKPAKELKIWMPHSHHVRNINTSTK